MNNQNNINWRQLWYHIYGISGLKDQHRVTILKNYDPKFNFFSIPITWNFRKLHLLRYEQAHSKIQKGRHWPDYHVQSFRKKYLPIKNRTMDRVSIFSEDHEKIDAGSPIISEAKRILTIDGRLTLVVKANAGDPDLEICKHLRQSGFSNIIVGRYIPARTSDANGVMESAEFHAGKRPGYLCDQGSIRPYNSKYEQNDNFFFQYGRYLVL